MIRRKYLCSSCLIRSSRFLRIRFWLSACKIPPCTIGSIVSWLIPLIPFHSPPYHLILFILLIPLSPYPDWSHLVLLALLLLLLVLVPLRLLLPQLLQRNNLGDPGPQSSLLSAFSLSLSFIFVVVIVLLRLVSSVLTCWLRYSFAARLSAKWRFSSSVSTGVWSMLSRKVL